ncbi:MAG: YlbF family regulator [Oscillospiraceae bacterium]|jgi:cell fate (sporulation/competence/biofilm development) regulator YlbF (YheA/YmcA/DUF963 family)|nr:YlbF family regulator [Oscillospiraceae bacterium]
MDIIEQTRALGAAIQQDSRFVALQIARQSNEEDEGLQELIKELNLQRLNLNNEISKEPRDEEKVKAINTAFRAVYDEIMQNPNMQNYEAAKTDMDALTANITGILALCVNGEDPETCTPSGGCGSGCSGCAGCGD